MGTLDGKIALITGASKGIGWAIAAAFARQGAALALVARGAPELEHAAEELRGEGARVLPIVCDVRDAQGVQSLPQRVENGLGVVHIVVNNAGVAGSHKFLNHPDDLWERLLDANLTSVYRVSKAFVPGMVAAGWGRIINLASVASKVGQKYMAAYTASKHGVLGLTRALAVELNEHHITVNAICPGYVDTPMTDAAVANIVARTGRTEEETRDLLRNTSPQQRFIEPAEVAAVAVMLASEEAGGITGQAINVDGGAVMF